MEPLLRVENVSKSFPGVHALCGVNLHVMPGEVLSVIGENGAGKSTLMKILAGVQAPDSGSLWWQGRAVHFHSTSQAMEAGISLIHQELNLAENLSIAENEKAVLFLMNEVFRDSKIPCIIAGKNPSTQLLKRIKSPLEIRINPSASEMQTLIQEAHINILPAFQNTGIKLKLLHALFMGRHCLVNPTMVEGSVLKEAVQLAEDGVEFRKAIDQLMSTPFEEADINQRKIQMRLFDNQMNARKIFNILQSHYP